MWKLTFISVLIMASTAVALDCGTQLDPRSYPAEYAKWCDCMGGTVDYSAGVGCVGATGPRQESTPSEVKHRNGGETAATDNSDVCNECDQGLLNDITVGLQSSTMIRTYVNQSRAKYANCIQILGISCSCGRQLFDNIPLACDAHKDETSYAVCVETLVNDARLSCQ